ncbi:MAG: DNA-3-methyladenine glycosylase I [Acetobacteraceae bacterium]|nr:DNA-3-methyladenine glycosylase I [Acetobacteraceae bacterium]
MCAYHDQDWGVPVHDDRGLFEFLILEGAQAGLSWSTVLARRAAYRDAFHGYDIERVARLSEDALEAMLQNPHLIRNRRKIFSARANARAALRVLEAGQNLDAFLWSFVDGKPITNNWAEPAQVPARTEQSDQMSRELRRSGFSFVGSTICYAFMQAVGMVNDHLISCFRHRLV